MGREGEERGYLARKVFVSSIYLFSHHLDESVLKIMTSAKY